MQPQPGAPQYAEQPSGSMRQPLVVSTTQCLFYLKMALYVIVAILLFLGFILQLSGIGSAHDDCEDETYSNVNCKDWFRSFWWTTFFELLVSVGIGLTMLFGMVKDTRVATVAFLGIATLQLINRAEDSLDLRNHYGMDEDDYRTAAAGYIMSAMANFILLLVLGIKRTPTPTVPTFMYPTAQPQAQAELAEPPDLPTGLYPRIEALRPPVQEPPRVRQ